MVKVGNWQFVRRYAKGSAGLWYVEARKGDKPFFNLTAGISAKEADQLMLDKNRLVMLAEKVEADRNRHCELCDEIAFTKWQGRYVCLECLEAGLVV